MERLLDKAARELKLDPAELRRRNFIAPSAFPYKTQLGDTYDVGEFERILERGFEEFRLGKLQSRRKKAENAANFAAGVSPPTSNGPARCRPRRWTSKSARTAR
jgi:carbon-monoxide dehydrogenase large subunit